MQLFICSMGAAHKGSNPAVVDVFMKKAMLITFLSIALQFLSGGELTAAQLINTFTQLTSGSGNFFELFPSISADGTRIAFVSNRDLVPGSPGNSDGNFELFLWTKGIGLRQLTNTVGTIGSFPPSINADGTRIAFAYGGDLTPGTPGNPQGNPQLFVWTDGFGFTQLTSAAGFGAAHSSISADGTRIAFTSTSEFIPANPGNADGGWEVFLWTQGIGVTQLTNTSFESQGPAGLSISGNGSRVAFRWDRDLAPGNPGNSDGNFEVFLWIQGVGIRQLTNTAGFEVLDNILSMSVDGTRIALSSVHDLTGALSNTDGNSELFLWTDGVGFTQLTTTTGGGFSGSASISGDGIRLAFFSNHDLTPGSPGNADRGVDLFLWVEGVGFTQLTNDLSSSNGGIISMSTVGTHIAFTFSGDLTPIAPGNPDRTFELFLADVVLLPTTQVPVVLVHGWCGSPGSFGSMRSLLEGAGFIVAEPFDYSHLTQVPSGGTNGVKIEHLASLLAAHIERVRQDHGATQVDVIAHSMGGLITRAWIAGMATAPISYEGQIRRLISIGTPNYGAEKVNWNDLRLAISKGVLFGNFSCSDTQAEQMRFGSDFILQLHDKWNQFQTDQDNPHKLSNSNMLFIAGTQDKDVDGRFECNDPQGCNDGVVDISSAVLPNTPDAMVRYISHKHATGLLVPFSSRSSIAFITDDEYLSIPTADQHPTYRLVKEYLMNAQVLPQCCGQNTVNYNPPHLRGIVNKREGLIVIRLSVGSSAVPLKRVNLLTSGVQFEPTTDFSLDRNSDTSSITIWGIRAPEDYEFTVDTAITTPTEIHDLHINVAHPSVLSVPLECRRNLGRFC